MLAPFLIGATISIRPIVENAQTIFPKIGLMVSRCDDLSARPCPLGVCVKGGLAFPRPQVLFLWCTWFMNTALQFTYAQLQRQGESRGSLASARGGGRSPQLPVLMQERWIIGSPRHLRR